MICGCSTKQHRKERDNLQFGCGLDNVFKVTGSGEFPTSMRLVLREGRGTSCTKARGCERLHNMSILLTTTIIIIMIVFENPRSGVGNKGQAARLRF